MAKIYDPEYPTHPLQSYIDRMGARWQQERAETQLTLGKFIDLLRTLPQDRTIAGIGSPDSYRGYYDDLAFRPTSEVRTVADVLNMLLVECMGRTFCGYKGGDYLMGEHTPLWIAEYGDCGDKLVALNVDASPITPVTQPDSYD
jgi:hypothetical protein